MMNLKKKRVLLLTNAIYPCRIPLFNAISKENDFDIKVLIIGEKDKNREWNIDKETIKFDYHILGGYHWFIWKKRRKIPIHLSKGLLKKYLEYKPDIVIASGYGSLAYWQIFLYCKIYKKKFILCNGTTLLSAGNIKGIKGLLKHIIIRGANKYLVYGTKAKEYLEYFGAKTNDIYISTNTVDMNYFQIKAIECRNKDNFKKIRKKYPKHLFLYVGQLVKRKGVIQVLKALNFLQDPEIGLLIVGSGPQEKELKKYCKGNNLNNVFFKGFLQQKKLPKYYALADIFILPSFEEVWGLVVNEALASGLYILSSKYAGASYDLIKKGWSGEIFNPNNIDEIIRLIKQTKEKIEDIRIRRGDISRHACREFNIELSAKVFLKAIKNV